MSRPAWRFAGGINRMGNVARTAAWTAARGRQERRQNKKIRRLERLVQPEIKYGYAMTARFFNVEGSSMAVSDSTIESGGSGVCNTDVSASIVKDNSTMAFCPVLDNDVESPPTLGIHVYRPLINIAEGDEPWQRTGDRVNLRYLCVRGFVWNPTNQENHMVRVMLVYDSARRTDLNTVEPPVLVNTGDVYSDYHPLYVRNASRKVDKVDIKGKTVSVVYDTGLFALAPTNANNSGHNNMRSFNIRKRLNKILTWSTAQGVSNAAGQYYFVIVTSAAATAYSFGCSYYYIDL